MARSVARGKSAFDCTFFEQPASLARTEVVHLFNAGDWPIPTI